jgi:predicted PhzF superfamily epimerase YddE/YHI9
MRTSIFQVDAFTQRLFGENPAAVMPMPTFPDDVSRPHCPQVISSSPRSFLIIF